MANTGGQRNKATNDLPAGSEIFARKLEHFAPLSASDRRMLLELGSEQECVPAHRDLIREGDTPRPVFLVLDGMAIRYRDMRDGGRQIMTFLIPGDLCNMHVFLIRAMDHSIGTVTPVRIATIERDRMMDLFHNHPRISAALWWSAIQEEAMLRERIVSLGRRDARGRIAYLLCELLWRHSSVGLTNGHVLRLALTQSDIGDTLGLTPVHVNRILREFRERKLIVIEQRMLSLLDVSGLEEIAGFSKAYLHLEGASDETIRYLDRMEAVRQA